MKNGTTTPRPRVRAALAAAVAAGLGVGALTALPAAAAGDAVTVQYRNGGSGASQAAPWLKVVNTGSTAVALSQVKVRYYFRADSAPAAYSFACDWAVKGCANVTDTFGTIVEPGAPADRYLEIGFTAGAGSLAPGADSGDLQLRFHRTGWLPLDQGDDYSFGPAQTAYANWSRVTASVNGVAVWGTAPVGNTPGPTTPPVGAALFDDFDYTGHTDPAIGAHGWNVRSGGGGPGVSGATWAPENVSFAKEGGNSVMTLRTTTAGTGESTRQTEFHSRAQKFRNGTYAARVRFADAPVSGPDGDHLVQSFFAINDLKAPMADDYAEYDFEYLPNGGWGEPADVFYATSWETYGPDGADNRHTAVRAGYAGWHDLVLTIDDEAVVYHVDGAEFARHEARFLPERPVAIHFNQWLTDFAGLASTTPRAYEESVDYVLHVKDRVLTPAQVGAAVTAYRAAGTTFTDSVPATP
ncbi:cellulose binding domain-containing protein [Streptomyces sp. BE303]|uniref:cellulose binding domain-containing protein n=1 Tax=Streptomyces sp. BE303 TaxID=3002528 RepID=UPI002E7A7712|nr:cellulose binding domain-containing protein [Streptomyces sp. BE303]MED7953043.1 cellulose binding domain-containing protein [Streptomyces sp. BE303]